MKIYPGRKTFEMSLLNLAQKIQFINQSVFYDPKQILFTYQQTI